MPEICLNRGIRVGRLWLETVATLFIMHWLNLDAFMIYIMVPVSLGLGIMMTRSARDVYPDEDGRFCFFLGVSICALCIAPVFAAWQVYMSLGAGETGDD